MPLKGRTLLCYIYGVLTNRVEYCYFRPQITVKIPILLFSVILCTIQSGPFLQSLPSPLSPSIKFAMPCLRTKSNDARCGVQHCAFNGNPIQYVSDFLRIFHVCDDTVVKSLVGVKLNTNVSTEARDVSACMMVNIYTHFHGRSKKCSLRVAVPSPRVLRGRVRLHVAYKK